jgi:glutathione S-transferase
MKIQLFYAPTTCALVPYVNLTEAGASFEPVPVDTHRGQNRTPEYLKLNPLHKVPVLIVDGKTLTENVAIQTWIARTFPAARLLPADPWDELQAISLMAWCASGIHPHLARYHGPARYCGDADPEGVRSIAKEMVLENFRKAEDLLRHREYFFDHFTAADSYFFWCFRRAVEFSFDLSAFPNCSRHFAGVAERPSVRKVVAYEREVKTMFGRP